MVRAEFDAPAFFGVAAAGGTISAQQSGSGEVPDAPFTLLSCPIQR